MCEVFDYPEHPDPGDIIIIFERNFLTWGKYYDEDNFSPFNDPGITWSWDWLSSSMLGWMRSPINELGEVIEESYDEEFGF
jgi:hypothetical protein